LEVFPKAFNELILALGMNLFSKRQLCGWCRELRHHKANNLMFPGDLIFSGHTIVLVMLWFAVAEYSPRRYQRCLCLFQGLLSVG
jgi:hypothetical protein